MFTVKELGHIIYGASLTQFTKIILALVKETLILDNSYINEFCLDMVIPTCCPQPTSRALQYFNTSFCDLCLVIFLDDSEGQTWEKDNSHLHIDIGIKWYIITLSYFIAK